MLIPTLSAEVNPWGHSQLPKNATQALFFLWRLWGRLAGKGEGGHKPFQDKSTMPGEKENA